MLDNENKWTVNLHYADPEDPNSDACETGVDLDSEIEARACIADFLAGKSTHFSVRGNPAYYSDVPYIELIGSKDSNVYEVIRRPKQIAQMKRENEECNREYAMQCGMAFGTQGYNNALGYD